MMIPLELVFSGRETWGTCLLLVESTCIQLGPVKGCTGNRARRSGSYLLHDLYDTACLDEGDSGSQINEGEKALPAVFAEYHNIQASQKDLNCLIIYSSYIFRLGRVPNCLTVYISYISRLARVPNYSTIYKLLGQPGFPTVQLYTSYISRLPRVPNCSTIYKLYIQASQGSQLFNYIQAIYLGQPGFTIVQLYTSYISRLARDPNCSTIYNLYIYIGQPGFPTVQQYTSYISRLARVPN